MTPLSRLTFKAYVIEQPLVQTARACLRQCPVAFARLNEATEGDSTSLLELRPREAPVP